MACLRKKLIGFLGGSPYKYLLGSNCMFEGFIWVVVSKVCFEFFTPNVWGNDSQFDEDMFQMGEEKPSTSPSSRFMRVELNPHELLALQTKLES